MANELDVRLLWEKSKSQENTTVFTTNVSKPKGTKTTLYWIQTILRIEFWLSIIAVPIVLFVLAKQEKPYEPAITYLLITAIYLFYYQFLINRIKRFQYDGHLIRNLKKIYGYLRFYLLHYQVVIWLALIVGTIQSILSKENQALLSQFQDSRDWVVLVLFTMLWIGIVGAFFHLLLHLIYGRKIHRLKKMVRILEKEI